jgi:hypothetical protein
MTPPPTSPVLAHWNVSFTYTPDPARFTAKTVVIHVNATSPADALTKTQARVVQNTNVSGCVYSFGTPATGWIDR